MPSRRHDLLAWAVPRLRKSRELDSEPAERARVERWHATLDQGLDRRLPTRLVPGCRLLASRAAGADWDLTYVEEPGLLHVYPLLPLVPEARRAWGSALEFLR